MPVQTVDITPTPRVLSILGDIPFSTWQCIAELVDNSLDAFASARRRGIVFDRPKVEVCWSREDVGSSQREISIRDNGTGMDLDTLQNAARAGFSSNDPIHNLGLFGMGFNIATAKLGDETCFLSATREADCWTGIRINFDELQRSGTFLAPVITMPKASRDESGTLILVRRLKDGIVAELSSRASQIRMRLEKAYTPILSERNVVIVVQGAVLAPQRLCVWGESRFVVRKNRRIQAVQRIDKDFGDSFFDEMKNRYLREDEYEGLSDDERRNVVRRPRRLTGWLGIQRFCDPSNFGIDFIRNGRKILVGDKSFFQYENPETGTPILEYPIELGTTMGGRIVGELNVDYLIPTYQKNGFDTTDSSWALTRAAVRGLGPFLPKNRSVLGMSDANDSPLGLLVNAYRRLDPGTKNLSVENSLSKQFHREFLRGNAEYESDEKWFRAAQEHDRDDGGATELVDHGGMLTDNLADYGPDSGGDIPHPVSDTLTGGPGSPRSPALTTTPRSELLNNSVRCDTLSATYVFDARQGGFEVRAYQVQGIQIKENGVRRPCMTIQDGIEIDFFYDPSHPLLAEYPVTEKQLLLFALAERFAVRDRGLDAMGVFFRLVDAYMDGERINADALRSRAGERLSAIKEMLPEFLCGREREAKEIIEQDVHESEAFMKTLVQGAPSLFGNYIDGAQGAHSAFAFVPDVTVARLVKGMPDLFLDGHVFRQPYTTINLSDENMTRRLRATSVSVVVSYLVDAAAVVAEGQKFSKHEMIRYSKSLELLERLMV